MTERYPGGVANYVESKFFSGLRPSETTALRWADWRRRFDAIHPRIYPGAGTAGGLCNADCGGSPRHAALLPLSIRAAVLSHRLGGQSTMY